jgi:uncharacterized protein (TIGR02611 family)
MLFHTAKRITILIIGSSVVLVGIVLLVLPGPAFVVIPVGLSILATEFYWARKILNKFKEKVFEVADKAGLSCAATNNSCEEQPVKKEGACPQESSLHSSQ